MTTETKILGSIVIVAVILLAGGIFLLSRSVSGPSKDVTGAVVSQIDYSKGEKIGSDSAKVKVVEFSDFQCPACQTAEFAVNKVRAFPEDQVQFIYRHYPLPQHSHAREAANFAEAAGEQDKFWEMHDKLFETQTEWSGLDAKRATAFFWGLVKQLNLDENEINQALTDNALKAKIDNDMAEGNRLGVNSTPTFFVNGRKMNMQSFNDLIVAVEEELKK